MNLKQAIFNFLFVFIPTILFSQHNGIAWKMHVIDNQGYGADGVKLWQSDDYNVFTVSWEQSGETRCYVFNRQMQLKHQISVPAEGVEDAIIADLNGDKILEIISFLEKPGAGIVVSYAHGNWLENKDVKFLHKEIEPSKNQLWMFGEVCDMNNDGLADIVAGSKGKGASVSIFYQQKTKRWIQENLYNAGWIMTLELHDIDFDGDNDIFFTDRKGQNSGVKWIENTGSNSKNWPVHSVGLEGKEPMFSHLQLKKNYVMIFAGEKYEGTTLFSIKNGYEIAEKKLFALPEIGGTGLKDVCIGDIDNDGEEEIITSFERAAEKQGIVYSKKTGNSWHHYPLSGLEGIKFDLSLLFDMDNDGDLDLLNTEENNNSNTNAGLGFVWYENPGI